MLENDLKVGFMMDESVISKLHHQWLINTPMGDDILWSELSSWTVVKVTKVTLHCDAAKHQLFLDFVG
jgi:hypothetical protein